ncbi:MAG: hypothetical protein IJ848_01795 [Alphaproteobacteria bacterium]|nr:hypothetical protein [Alphaproteobacteria bacterium]
MNINKKYLVVLLSVISCYANTNENIKTEFNNQNNMIHSKINQRIEYAKQQLKCSEIILQKNPNDTMEQTLRIEMLDYIDYLTKLSKNSNISRNISPEELNMLGL